MTIGVLHRVDELADRPEGDEATRRDRFWSLIPLIEIIAQALDVGANSQKAQRAYDAMIDRFGSELDVLLDRPLAEIGRGADGRVAEGIAKMRSGEVHIEPGYDGVYGKIEIPFEEPGQMALL